MNIQDSKLIKITQPSVFSPLLKYNVEVPRYCSCFNPSEPSVFCLPLGKSSPTYLVGGKELLKNFHQFFCNSPATSFYTNSTTNRPLRAPSQLARIIIIRQAQAIFQHASLCSLRDERWVSYAILRHQNCERAVVLTQVPPDMPFSRQRTRSCSPMTTTPPVSRPPIRLTASTYTQHWTHAQKYTNTPQGSSSRKS